MRESRRERVNTVLRRATAKNVNAPADVEQRNSESKDLNVPAAVEQSNSEDPNLPVGVGHSEAAAAVKRSSNEREVVMDTGMDISEAHAVWI